MRCGDFRQSYAEDMSLFESPLPRVLLAGLLVFLLVLPQFATTYWLDVLNRIFIAIIAAAGLNMVTGYTGLISLGDGGLPGGGRLHHRRRWPARPGSPSWW